VIKCHNIVDTENCLQHRGLYRTQIPKLSVVWLLEKFAQVERKAAGSCLARAPDTRKFRLEKSTAVRFHLFLGHIGNARYGFETSDASFLSLELWSWPGESQTYDRPR